MPAIIIATENAINEADNRIDTAPKSAIWPIKDPATFAKIAIEAKNTMNVATPAMAAPISTFGSDTFCPNTSILIPFVKTFETTTSATENATNAPDITIDAKANFVKLPTSLPIIFATSANPVSNNKKVPTAAIAPIGSTFNTVLSAPPFMYFANDPTLMPFAKMFDAITKPTLNVTNAAVINNEPNAKLAKSPFSLLIFLASEAIPISNMPNVTRARIAPPTSNAGNEIEPMLIGFIDINVLAM